jgi:peptidoglycan/LPS O-acetylase OafA/YrhL
MAEDEPEGRDLSDEISYDFDLQEPLVVVVAALIVGACVLPLRGSRILDRLEWRPLAALGVASFSLYVWHWPILEALSGAHFGEAAGGTVAIVGEPSGMARLLLLGLPLSIVVGIVSYYVIERPFLRRRRGWGPAVTPADAPAPPPAPRA